ncbi:MAG: AraC family transcriptional regulator [Oscillospiraceae bacterium]|nr:AraC family transcriptional regulator [Oscillospiraceae bacterium]
MEWIDRLNQAVDYLEGHLEAPDLGEAARIACCSPYHFQRMFTLPAGAPLSEYIRRRKMSRAAADLQHGERIVDVALKYGYSSPTAFNRAFQAVHGLPPSAAKTPGAVLKSHPPLRFAITVQGVEEMEYRIEKRDAFRIVGVSAPLSKDMEENFQCVPQLWGKAAVDGTIPRLAGLMDGEPRGLLGVCDGLESARYYIAVASSAPAGEGLEEYTVPAFTWAVFPGTGEGAPAIQALERRVVTEWLPTSGYEYAEGPDVEVYLDPECTKFEVWIPVVKAKG